MFSIDHIIAELWPQSEPNSWQQRLTRFLLRPVYLQVSKPDSWSNRLLKRLMHEKEFQEIATRYPQHRGLDMAEKVLESLNLRCGVSEHSLEHIPKSGPLIIVANHPTSLLDGFVLTNAVSRVRRDIKIISNRLMMLFLEPVASLLIPVDQISHCVVQDARKQMHEQLESGGVLVIFPAGAVSRVLATGLQDIEWQSGFVRMARKYQASILPVFIHGRNSLGYYAMDMVSNSLSAILLGMKQMFRRKNSTMHLTIGEPIPFDGFDTLKLTDSEIAEKFRKHVMQLGKRPPSRL